MYLGLSQSVRKDELSISYRSRSTQALVESKQGSARHNQSSAEVTNAWNYTPFPLHDKAPGCVIKHKDSRTLTLILQTCGTGGMV